ncbi:thioredoxin family protein [Rhodopirellula halodulae]|uniref:thioredoxin family protein n=1 Tax=Rhodopirellula halodulae TaxID=2894198 RepID=UPI001E44DBF2|nr:thioredoxin family protein [Rhodopirellula sp. JC737]MCC9657363.1 thioredoxin family protein [Rhodopirellula sp. JC737]
MPIRRVFGLSIAAALSVSSFAPPVAGGEFNQVLDVGDSAPEWKDLPTTDGKLSSLEKLAESKLVVLAFTCNSCPYAVDAEDRLIKLTQDYADQSVAVVAVNVNQVEEDLMPAMKRKAAEKSFPFTYAFDETQQIARDYGAKYTPQFFLIDQDRKIAYMGSLDDSPDGREVKDTYLEDAIKALLDDKEVAVKETVPVGCRIRMERLRRSRRSR